MAKKERAITKVIYASFFSGTKLIKVVELKNQRTVTANWHTTKRVPAVLESINIRELMLHHDNPCSRSTQPPAKFLRDKGKYGKCH